MNHFWIALCIFVLSPSHVAQSKTPHENAATFPQRTELRSPDGRYTVQAITVCGVRRLFLNEKAKKQTSKTPINVPANGGNSFSRGLDVLWSPDSTFFMLNDWLGSEKTISYLYRTPGLGVPVEVNEKIKPVLIQQLGARKFNSLTFLYVYADRIEKSKLVRIRVEGNCPDEIHPAVSLTYLWDRDKKFTLLTDTRTLAKH